MSRNSWIAASVFALVAFGTGAGVTTAQQALTAPPAWVGDLANAQLVEVRDKSGQVLLHGTLTTKENTANETEREADLASPSGQAAKGEIEVEVERKDGAVTESEIEV